MKRWRTKALILAGVALAAAIPAIGQETPESLLPPGFGDPATLPPPVQNSVAPATPAPSRQAPPAEDTVVTDADETDLEALANAGPPRQPGAFDLPERARRDPARAGVLGPGNWGIGEDAFASADGRFLSSLMRRLDAPLPSRWTSILLRRALLTQAAPPSGVQPVDWVAERAWLLLRMGEADAARLLVQQVDVDRYSPKMMDVAVQTALATADPAALCPLVAPGRKMSDQPIWLFADAMCAAMAGESGRASTLIDEARRKNGSGIDLALAEKIVGAGSDTRRAANLEWEGVDGLNSWRFGMAAAIGAEIPERLMVNAAPQMWAWQARAPMIPLDRRLPAVNVAASLGILSNASMVEIYSLAGDRTDPAELRGSIAEQLGAAYTGSVEDRLVALRRLWDAEGTPALKHARLILTAAAAARIAPSLDREADAAQLVAAMLTAGLDRRAALWWPSVSRMNGDSGYRAWSLLAVAAPGISPDGGRLGDAIDNDAGEGKLRSRLLVAALAGLGRINSETAGRYAGDLGIDFNSENTWTRAIDRAAQRRQRGAVAVLAATGMQTADWQGVPPAHLYRIVRALRAVGMDYEARMIAAEALYRA
ncbi:MAG TPA: hypothetical protein VI381_01280 [Allosphingosinicella sp.]